MIDNNSGHTERCDQGRGAASQAVCKPQLVDSVDVNIFEGGQSDFSLVRIVNRASVRSVGNDVSTALSRPLREGEMK